jgi:hypothetical protein
MKLLSTSKLFKIGLITIFCSVLLSCKKSKNENIPTPTVIKEWNISLSAKYVNPAPINHNEAGNLVMQLLSNNTLKYNLQLSGLSLDNKLTSANLQIGDLITNGVVVLPLNAIFSGSTASGLVTNIRTTLIDSLKNDINDIYINVNSTQTTNGIVRGQLNTNVDFAMDVNLTDVIDHSNTTGLAIIRLSSNKKLYMNIFCSKLPSDDTYTNAHIHKEDTGDILIDVYNNTAQFGLEKVLSLNDAEINSLKTEALYVNVHTIRRREGILRGQIR